MNKENNSVKSDNILNLQNQNILLYLLPILYFVMKKGPSTLSFSGIDHVSLEKKTKLLNRIKGYMSPEEQSILHRAETILLTLARIKSVFEGPELRGAQTYYNSLSVDERKRNMLMDISEFVDHDRREAIYKAVELHTKAREVEDRLGRARSMSSNEVSIDTIERYIDVFDPILEGDLKQRSLELRKIIGMLKLMKSIGSKNSIDEMDLIEAVKPFMPPEQAESLGRMIQIVKAVSTIGNDTNKANVTSNDASNTSQSKNNEINNATAEASKYQGEGNSSYNAGASLNNNMPNNNPYYSSNNYQVNNYRSSYNNPGIMPPAVPAMPSTTEAPSKDQEKKNTDN